MEIRILVMVVLCTQASGQLLGGIPGMTLPGNPNQPDTVLGGLKGIIDAGFNRINKQLENLTLPPDPDPTPEPDGGDGPEGDGSKGDDPEDGGPEGGPEGDGPGDGGPESGGSEGGGSEGGGSNGGGSTDGASSSGNDGSNSGGSSSGSAASSDGGSTSVQTMSLPEFPNAHPPVDPKPLDWKPSDWNPFDPKPYDWQPSESNPFDPKPFDPKPYDWKPYDSKPLDPKPFDPKPYDWEPYDSKPYDSKPYDSKPFDTKPYDWKPSGSKPFDPQLFQPNPFDWRTSDSEPFDSKSFEPKPFDWKTSDLKPFDPSTLDNQWYTKPIGPFDYPNFEPKPIGTGEGPNPGNPWLNAPKPGPYDASNFNPKPFDNLQLTGPYDIQLGGKIDPHLTGTDLKTNFFDKNSGFEGSLTAKKDYFNLDTGKLTISSPIGDSETADFKFKADSDLARKYGYELFMETKSNKANAYLKGSSVDGQFPNHEAGVNLPFIINQDQRFDLESSIRNNPSNSATKYKLSYQDLTKGLDGYYSSSQTGNDPPTNSYAGSFPVHDTDLNRVILKGGYGEDPHIGLQIKDKINEQDHSITFSHDNKGRITKAEIDTSKTIDGKNINVVAQGGDSQKLKVGYGNLGSITAEQLENGRNLGVSTKFDVHGNIVDVEAQVGSQANGKVKVYNPESGSTSSFTVKDLQERPAIGVDISHPIWQTKDLQLNLNGGATLDKDGKVQGLVQVQGTFPG